MKHKIIKTENYLLVVDDSEIKVGDVITDKYNVWIWKDNSSLLGRKKVIAHLPLNNSPILKGVLLLPPFTRHQEDGIEELAELNGHPESSGFFDYKEGFLDGFLEAKDKYKYTEDDLRKAILLATTSKERNKMIKEFVSYEMALALKELGFDEPCFTYYKNDQPSNILELVKNSEMENVNNEVDNYTSAPTFSQAFKWFRDNYKLPSWVYTSNNEKFYYGILRDTRFLIDGNKPYETYEEAEWACLIKLIEVVILAQKK
jgi:hypothetical protein